MFAYPLPQVGLSSSHYRKLLSEEDYVLKQAFSSLVPAFDPRPGKTNVPQIQDFDVPAPGTGTFAINLND